MLFHAAYINEVVVIIFIYSIILYVRIITLFNCMEKSLYSTMNEKGQITIPASIRNKMQLQASNKFEFLNKGDFIIMLPVNKSLKDLKGFLPKPVKALSCDEMNEIIKNR